MLLDRPRQRSEARRLLGALGLELDLERPVGDCPLPVRQLVEIARALSLDSRVIVMDEPTSSLTAPEAERLFALIGRLKARGCGIIYISHKLEEIYRLADRITVLRDGRKVGTAAAADLPRPELIRWMVGRAVTEQFPSRGAHPGPELLRVEDFSLRARGTKGPLAVDRVSFALRAGEMVGVAGLQGSGHSELLGGLFGRYGAPAAGRVTLAGAPLPVRSPAGSIARGLALLTNDRKAEGIIPELSIRENISLAALGKFSRAGWLDAGGERRAAASRARELDLRAAGLEQPVGTLSGGNQQKVVLARWLETSPRVLLLDEPTRGVDVAVKQEIYQLMDRLTAEGRAILLITSEMPELLALSDRIMVMSRGRRCTAEFCRGPRPPRKKSWPPRWGRKRETGCRAAGPARDRPVARARPCGGCCVPRPRGRCCRCWWCSPWGWLSMPMGRFSSGAPTATCCARSRCSGFWPAG